MMSRATNEETRRTFVEQMLLIYPRERRDEIFDQLKVWEELQRAFGFDKVVKWHDIGEGVKWRYYKHWGQNVWAGEGRTEVFGDKGGCIIEVPSYPRLCLKPIVFLARLYKKGDKEISAILSYPNGIGAEDTYFWEIYPIKGFRGEYDCERFLSEEEMEMRIKELMRERRAGGSKRERSQFVRAVL